MKKMKKQADVTDPSETQTSLNKEKLHSILGDHDLGNHAKKNELVEALINWKK